MNFSAWLAAAAAEQDLVVVCMDMGEGREFALLRKLLQDGALLLIDRLFIRWHYNLAVRRQRSKKGLLAKIMLFGLFPRSLHMSWRAAM